MLRFMGSQRVRHDLATFTFTNNFKPFMLHIPEYSLERLKLKLQYFGYLIQRIDSLENTLMLGKIEKVKIMCLWGRPCQRAVHVSPAQKLALGGGCELLKLKLQYFGHLM